MSNLSEIKSLARPVIKIACATNSPATARLWHPFTDNSGGDLHGATRGTGSDLMRSY